MRRMLVYSCAEPARAPRTVDISFLCNPLRGCTRVAGVGSSGRSEQEAMSGLPLARTRALQFARRMNLPSPRIAVASLTWLQDIIVIKLSRHGVACAVVRGFDKLKVPFGRVNFDKVCVTKLCTSRCGCVLYVVVCTTYRLFRVAWLLTVSTRMWEKSL